MISNRDVETLVGGIAPILRELLARIAALEAQLASPDEHRRSVVDLQLRVAELEQRPQLAYHGVYQGGKQYERGSIVTWSGSAWICSERTSAKPGTSDIASRAWRLFVQRGKDGRDFSSKGQG